MKHLIVCIVVSFVLGCGKENGPVSSNDQRGSFEVYLLKDSSLTGYQASQIDIHQLELRDNPWLTDEGIDFYDFSSHCIYLNGDKSDYFEGYDPVSGPRPLFTARAFVVVANAERCYVGSLHSAVLSSVPWGPYMDELSVWHYPEDVVHIAKSRIDTHDVRNDSRIQGALNSLGLYRGGISVQLKSVAIVENSDTSTIEYVFTVTNKDRDNLFVPDPDNMGTGLFHYYTNGIVIRGSSVLFQSLYKKTLTPSVKWDPAWFVQVPVNATIERTVQLKGYPKITPGTYNCSFLFASPVQVEKAYRSLQGGRVWIGDIASNHVEIVVQ